MPISDRVRLDSRQRKKTHTEKLELERKEWLAEKEELENTITYLRDRMESLSTTWSERRREYETLLREVTDERDEAVRTKALETDELTRRNNVLEDSVRDLKRQLDALVDTSCTAASDTVTAHSSPEHDEASSFQSHRQSKAAPFEVRGADCGALEVRKDPVVVGTYSGRNTSKTGESGLPMPYQTSSMGNQYRDWRDSEDSPDDTITFEGKKEARDFEVMSSLARQDLDSIENASAANEHFLLIQKEEALANLNQKEEGNEDTGAQIGGSIRPSTDVSYTCPQLAARAPLDSPASRSHSEDSARSSFVEVSISEATAIRDPEESWTKVLLHQPAHNFIGRGDLLIRWYRCQHVPRTRRWRVPALPREHTLDSLAKAEWNLDSRCASNGKTRKAFASGQQSASWQAQVEFESATLLRGLSRSSSNVAIQPVAKRPSMLGLSSAPLLLESFLSLWGLQNHGGC